MRYNAQQLVATRKTQHTSWIAASGSANWPRIPSYLDVASWTGNAAAALSAVHRFRQTETGVQGAAASEAAAAVAVAAAVAAAAVAS